jgi:putative NADH-flavin reductase
MKIALIGISGRVGSRLAAELLKRGHAVTGIARDVSNVEPKPNLRLDAADANHSESLAPLLEGHDVVVSSARFVSTDPGAVIAATKKAQVPRLMVVGGAGSLEVAPGVALMDTPEFPEAYKPEARGGRAFLEALRAEKTLDWVFLSPSAEFEPGERTGKYRLGGDQLLMDAKGRSWISMEDYAIAFADELEDPKHSRQRFTVGY